jgi:DNA modification methylase
MLDPFLGIGNSAVAARNSGLTNFIGFEIDEEYLREAERRLETPRLAKRRVSTDETSTQTFPTL